LVEADGGQHTIVHCREIIINSDTPRAKDIQCVHFWNNDINNNLEGVLENNKKGLPCLTQPLPNPPSGGREAPQFAMNLRRLKQLQASLHTPILI